MSASIDDIRQEIEKEFATGSHALRSGNAGMARVCARRAAGAAIRFWLQYNPRNWKQDVIGLLHAAARDAESPSMVRDACVRLTARINVNFQSSFSTNPLDDASIIVSHFLSDDER